MAKYKITSPDGRTVTVSGESAPTEEDAAAIFSEMGVAERAPIDQQQYGAAFEEALSALEPQQAPMNRGIPLPIDSGYSNLSNAQKLRESAVGTALLGQTGRQDAQTDALLSGMNRSRMYPDMTVLEKAQDKAIATVDNVGEMGVQGFVPAMAQAAAAEFTGPFAPITVPAAGFVAGGGTNALVQAKRMLLGQQKGFKKGEMAGNAIASSFPGGAMVKAGYGTILKEVAKSVVVNNVALATQNAIDSDPQYQKLVSAAQQAQQAGDTKAAEELKNLALNYRFKQHAFATAAGIGGPLLSKYLDRQSNKLAKDVEKAALAGSTERELVQRVQAEKFMLPANILNKENKGMLGKINKMMLNTASPPDTINAMMDRNQKVQQELIRKQMYETPYGKEVAAKMGLDISTPFTDEILDNIKKSANAPYGKIDAIAANARNEMEMLKKSVFTVPAGSAAAVKLKELHTFDTPSAQKMRSLQEQLGSQHLEDFLQAKETLTALRKAKAAPEGVRTVADHVQLRKEIKQQSEVVEKLEAKLRSAVSEAGHPQLVDELIQARVIQAQVAAIKDAMTGGVHVDATKLAASNAPLTGNLKLVADFQNNFGKYLGDAASVKPVDTGKLSKFMFGGIGAATGSMINGVNGGLQGALIGGAVGEMVPGRLQGVARDAVLSQNYQKYMTKPYYGYNIPDFNATAAKYMTMQAGRKE